MRDKQIIYFMKEEMEFLRRYTRQLRVQKSLYGQNVVELEANDDIMDYLSYTKSIIDVTNTTRGSVEPAFEAMKRKQSVQVYLEKRNQHAYMLMQAIKGLDSKDRSLLLDVYVKNLDRKVILYRHGDIVESTYYRRLDKALLALYDLISNVFEYPSLNN